MLPYFTAQHAVRCGATVRYNSYSCMISLVPCTVVAWVLCEFVVPVLPLALEEARRVRVEWLERLRRECASDQEFDMARSQPILTQLDSAVGQW